MVYRTFLERGTAVSIRTQVTTTQVVTETSTVELDTTNIATLLADFANAKLAIKELEKAKSELDSAIRDLIGSAKVGTIAGLPVVELAPRSRTNVDSTLLKEVYPEAYETCSKVSTYDIIVAK
jgi:predicted phage-related endonuclease